MLTDALVPVSWRTRPRSFVALMSLYESNYLRLVGLAGPPTALEGRYRSRVAGDCELWLAVDERPRDTSTRKLPYCLADGREPVETPDMRLRVYHDARLVEALDAARDCEGDMSRTPRGLSGCELHRRWVRNVALNKWLEYCVERGHRFPPVG
ncbi:MAG: DUF1249 domain-containing protein [Gammaproteobacteria bacterium]|nr:DUF1249 domain-containing protein [Gammaproteobacteria bacterium]